MVALAGLGALMPVTTLALPISVSRTFFPESATANPRALPRRGLVQFGPEKWRMEGVARLRIESEEPEIVVVLRFRPRPGAVGELLLTVILQADPGLFGFLYETHSQVIAGGEILAFPETRVGEGIETDLEGVTGAVTEIRVQDDGAAELRLLREGDLLRIVVVPVEAGGEPARGAHPFLTAVPLTFLEYTVLGAAWEDNGLGDLFLFEHFGFSFNALSDAGTSATLARAVVRVQMKRWERFSLWVEGGAGFFQLDPEDPSQEAAGIPTWAFGLTAHFRSGNWGAAGHVATVNGPLLVTVLGGWQFSPSWGALLSWQSFQGLSGFGVGASLAF